MSDLLKIIIIGDNDVGKTTTAKMLSLCSGGVLSFKDTSTVWFNLPVPGITQKEKNKIKALQKLKDTWKGKADFMSELFNSVGCREALAAFYNYHGMGILTTVLEEYDIYAGLRNLQHLMLYRNQRKARGLQTFIIIVGEHQLSNLPAEEVLSYYEIPFSKYIRKEGLTKKESLRDLKTYCYGLLDTWYAEGLVERPTSRQKALNNAKFCQFLWRLR